MTKEQQILALLSQNPFLQQNEIAETLGLTRSSVAGYIMNLTNKGKIRGKGYILAPNKRIVTLGGTNMDIAGTAALTLRLHDSNLGKIKCSAGGVARNIAQNIAMLGQESHLISVVGDDPYGATVLETTRLAGVKVERCYQLSGETTSTYLSLHDHSGEMVVAINDMGILDRLTPALLSSRLEFIQHSDVVVLDCNLSEKTLAWIFNNCNQPIFVDPVSTFKASKIKSYLHKIHTLKPNRLEAEVLSGIKIEQPKNLNAVAHWFHQHGLQRLVVSLGADGVFYSEKEGNSGMVPAFKTNIINVTGAGDAMMAGLACCYLDNKDFPESIHYAQACSSLALSSEFTNNPNLSDDSVQKLLETQQ
ncbi:PfkB family carbohydrate kinase [Lonepinella sp. BR2271]|uniref:PfkB family carbohydrate kinase n=1 Tax=Lonepinella sp. BR2271 TaxID=3434550 RepID=UPI003F6E1817